MTPAEISKATADECVSRIESLNEFLGGEGGRPERISADKARVERALLAERLEEIAREEGRSDVREGDIYADEAGHDEMGKPL